MSIHGFMQGLWAGFTLNPLGERLIQVSVEVAACAALVGLAIRLLRLQSPRVRSLLWLLVLVKGLVGLSIGSHLTLVHLPAATTPVAPSDAIARFFDQDAADDEIASTEYANLDGREVSDKSQADAWDSAGEPAPVPAPSVGAIAPAQGLFGVAPDAVAVGQWVAKALLLAWLAGVLWMLTRTLLDVRGIRRLRAEADPAPDAIRQMFVDEARRLGVRQLPELHVTGWIDSPALVGYFRPMVLVPRWIADQSDDSRLRWLLAHELMHWARKDTFGLLLRRLAEIFLWFHPLVWWAGRRWEEEMERACDRALVAAENEAREYAENLFRVLEGLVARNAPARRGLGLFATRTQVGRRIELLLSNPLATPARLGILSLIGLGVMAAVTLTAGIGVKAENASADPASPAAQASQPAAPAVDPVQALWQAWCKVDFGRKGQKVEAGWIECSQKEHLDLSAAFDPAFKLDLTTGLEWRDRGNQHGSYRHERVLQDGCKTGDKDIALTFTDLAAGDYALVLFSCDRDADDDRDVGSFDVLVDIRPVLENQKTMRRIESGQAALAPVQFTAPGEGGSVRIVLKRKSGVIWLNGFMLTRLDAERGRTLEALTALARPVELGKISAAEIPAPVRETIARELDDQPYEVARKIRGQKVLYEVDTDKGPDVALFIDEQGALLWQRKELKIQDLPEPVMNSYREALVRALAEKADVVMSTKDGVPTYHIETRTDGKTSLAIDANGALLNKSAKK